MRTRFLLLIVLVALAFYLTLDSKFSLRSDVLDIPLFGDGVNSEQIIDTDDDLESIAENGSGIESGGEITDPEEKVALPDPLIADKEVDPSTLTVSGVIFWTNYERIAERTGVLRENSVLDKIASRKLKDMFDLQYFEHVSPSGDAINDVAELFGYEYLMIGENLALGNFKSDKDLVLAWMGSPGHRENILNENYTEIGVAVGEGEFEGRTVWISVQVFGLPSSACPSVDRSLRKEIDDNEEELKALEADVIDLKEEIESMHPKSGELYADKIDEYNSMVYEYNDLVKDTKSLISEYNEQVNAYNSCIDALGI